MRASSHYTFSVRWIFRLISLEMVGAMTVNCNSSYQAVWDRSRWAGCNFEDLLLQATQTKFGSRSIYMYSRHASDWLEDINARSSW